MKSGKYVVAVSGGVDSVVLLDMLSRMPNLDLVVAHFDHGIRPESADDAMFVEELAAYYGLPFETQRVELGPKASEELARRYRYNFLREVASRHSAKIITAHHADDVVETIAINHVRGTGWRGLAVLDSADVLRPMIYMNKDLIRQYAREHNLQWREDSTNSSDAYLRNRLRRRMTDLSDDKKQALLNLHNQQKNLKRDIDLEVEKLVNIVSDLSGEGKTYYSRYFFTHIHPVPALAILRRVTNGQLTRPQLERALMAIKTSGHNTTHHAGKGVEMHFTSRHFTVELLK